MRLVGLLLVVGIIGFFWSRRGGRVSPVSEIDEELMATPKPIPGMVSPSSTPVTAAPQAASSGLRRPIDHTRSVLEKVKGRNGDEEF
jgi:hypothetical protein